MIILRWRISQSRDQRRTHSVLRFWLDSRTFFFLRFCDIFFSYIVLYVYPAYFLVKRAAVKDVCQDKCGTDSIQVNGPHIILHYHWRELTWGFRYTFLFSEQKEERNVFFSVTSKRFESNSCCGSYIHDRSWPLRFRERQNSWQVTFSHPLVSPSLPNMTSSHNPFQTIVGHRM